MHIGVLFITYVPALTTALPRWFGGEDHRPRRCVHDLTQAAAICHREPGNVHANIQMMTVSNRPGGHMLQTAESDRRLFWWVLTAISAIAAVVTWIAFGTMA